MYSVMPAKMKNIDILSVHPKVIAKMYPKLWRAFMIHELEKTREIVSEENIVKWSIEIQKKVPDNEELNRPYLINIYLELVQNLVPIVLPSFKRDDHGLLQWFAYVQMPGPDDKDIRNGLGAYGTRWEAETVAMYKCFDIIEERS